MRVLVWTGGSTPFANLPAFVAHVKRTYPGITDRGVSQLVKKALDHYDPGVRGRIVTLFGADIMTADLERIPAWPYLSDDQRRRLREHPHDTGERVNEDDPKLSQLELARTLNRASVNRSALISPPGLSQTYVWSDATHWQQEMSDTDAALILSIRGTGRLFRDFEAGGAYAPVRSYDVYPVIARHAGNAADLQDYINDRTRVPHWQGADTKR